MTTFDSTKASLSDLLLEIKGGKVQLPDFLQLEPSMGKLAIQLVGHGDD